MAEECERFAERSNRLLRGAWPVRFLWDRAEITTIDPIKALYWSAVVNGVLAAPVRVILKVLVRRPKVMGKLVVTGPLYWLGWLATGAMALFRMVPRMSGV